MNLKNRKITVAHAAALTALLAPVLAFGTAVPAHAADRTVYRDGCWVTPRTPTVRPHTSHPKRINYTITVRCAPQRIIFFEQVAYEDDSRFNQPIGARKKSQVFNQVSGPITVSFNDFTRPLPDTEAGAEEVFHEVRFRVGHLSNGYLGYMTGWIQSPNLNVAN